MATIDVQTLEIRPMRGEDLERIVAIDALYSGSKREDYYQEKITGHLDTSHHLVLSFVACRDGKVVGFLMGEVSRGAYGLPEQVACVDTIGVDPAYKQCGVANELMHEFKTHAKRLGVATVYTLVRWEDESLINYFRSSGFRPGNALYLEHSL